VPPVSLPRFSVSDAEQVPTAVVLPRTIVAPLIAHTLFVPLGPVEVVIGWLKLRVIVSFASSLPAVPPFAAVADVTTTPSCAAAVGLPETLVHDA
jgi:hypothetical protein